MDKESLRESLAEYDLNYVIPGTGHTVVHTLPGYAIDAIIELLAIAEDRARIDELSRVLAIKVSHPEAYQVALAIHADARLAALSTSKEKQP